LRLAGGVEHLLQRCGDRADGLAPSCAEDAGDQLLVRVRDRLDRTHGTAVALQLGQRPVREIAAPAVVRPVGRPGLGAGADPALVVGIYDAVRLDGGG